MGMIPTCRVIVIKLCVKFLILRSFLINDAIFMTPILQAASSFFSTLADVTCLTAYPLFPLPKDKGCVFITVTCILQMRNQRNHKMKSLLQDQVVSNCDA